MKKAIGMYFLDTRIHMAQVSWHMGQPAVERTAGCDWNRTHLHTQKAPIAHDIEAAIKHEGLDPSHPVIVGLPGDWVSYVPVETDAIRDQDLTRFLQFELEDDVPIPFENFQIDMLGPHRTDKKLQGLAVVCDGSETEAMCQLLESAGLNVQSMCPDLVGLEGLIGTSERQKDVEWTLHLHLENMRCLLILTKNNIVSIGRSLRCSTESEASLIHNLTPILREVFTGPLHGVRPDNLDIVASMPKKFESAVTTAFGSIWNDAIEVRETDSLKESNKPSDVAEQLAATYLRGSPMPNFLASQLTQKQLKKQMHFAGRLMILLLALLSLMWGVDAYLKIKALQDEQAQLTHDIETIFRDHLPEITKIVQPVTQISNYLNTYRKDSDFLTQAVNKRALPLQVLGYVSAHVNTKRNISITFLDIEATNATIAGIAPSYESVEALADDLRSIPNFTNVQLGDVAANRTDGQVSFEMSISRGMTL